MTCRTFTAFFIVAEDEVSAVATDEAVIIAVELQTYIHTRKKNFEISSCCGIIATVTHLCRHPESHVCCAHRHVVKLVVFFLGPACGGVCEHSFA